MAQTPTSDAADRPKSGPFTIFGVTSLLLALGSLFVPTDSPLLFVLAGAAVVVAIAAIAKSARKRTGLLLPIFAILLGLAVFCSSAVKARVDTPKREALTKFITDLASGDRTTAAAAMAGAYNDSDLQDCIDEVKTRGQPQDINLHFRGSFVIGDLAFPDHSQKQVVAQMSNASGTWKVLYFLCFSRGEAGAHVGSSTN